MSMADLFRQVGRKSSEGDYDTQKVLNIIEFVESPFGLGFSQEICGMSLFPVQKFLLKAFYNLPLDDSTRNIKVPKTWRQAQSAKPDDYYRFTEVEYMRYLYNEGRCNIKEQDHDRHELVLPIGRRSGKSTISSMIAAYEVYRLLRKANPQRYYGIQDGAEITISTIATTKDQSQILYNGVRNHFQSCEFYAPYLSHDTQSYVRFQTPYDIDQTGEADDGGRASVQIKFFSSVSSGIRGLANIVIILDEVAFFKEKGNSSANAVYQAASPSVATFAPADPNGQQETLNRDSEGRIIMISSPFNKDGLFYNKYEQSKVGGSASRDILMVQAPTWEVNPQVPVGFLENAHGKDPVAFATEFGAEFTDRVMAWIEREKDLMVCLDRDLRPSPRGKPRTPHSLGLDLAVKGDRTSVALTRPDGDKIRLVYHEEWQAGKSWYDLNPHLEEPIVPYAKELHTVDILDFDALAEWIKELSRRFYIVDGVFDQWQGISFKQTLDKMDMKQLESKQFTRDESSQMFDAFKTLMYHGRLMLYDYMLRDVDEDEDEDFGVVNSALDEGTGHVKHAPYIKQLLELRAERKSKKVVLVEAPNGPNKHDDFADALVRSVWLTLHRVGNPKYISGSKSRMREIAEEMGADHYKSMSSQQYQRRRQRRHNYSNKRGDRMPPGWKKR